MLQLIAGLVLGAVLGVAADRFWTRIESAVRIEIRGGYFENVRGEQGFVFTIRNVGTTDIPECRICVCHPRRGSLFAFEKKTPGPLLPDQEDRHECPLVVHGKVNDHLASWFLTIDGKPITDEDAQCYTFRLVMTKGDRTLYENAGVGNALATQFRKVSRSGNFKGITISEAMELQVLRRPSLLSRMRQRRRGRRRNKGNERHHANANPGGHDGPPGSADD